MRSASPRAVALVLLLLLLLLPTLPASAQEGSPALITGRVLAHDGTPIVGASLSFEPLGKDQYEAYGYASSSANGSYEVELQEGLYRARISPPYGKDLAATTLELRCIRVDNADCIVALAGSSASYDFTLPPAGILRGFVRDEQGVAIRSAYVRLGSYDASASTDSGGAYLITAGSGAYAMDVEGGYDRTSTTLPYSLPCQRIDRSDCVVLQNGTVTWHNITLESGGTLRGTIVDSDGVPVTDASVISGETRDYGGYDGEYSLLLPAGPHPLNVSRGYSPRGDIAYLKCVAPDKSDCARVRSRETTWVNITLPATPRLRGFVMDADGKGVSASLTLNSIEAGSDYGYANETGAYNVEMEPGAYSLSVRPESRGRGTGTGSGSFHIECADPLVDECVRIANGTTWLNITLPRAASLRGFVLDSSGAPLANAHVSARGLVSSINDQSATTEANGSYHLTLAPGSYGLTVYVFGGDSFSEPVEVRCDSQDDPDCVLVEAGATSWRNVTLPASAFVSGTVRTPDGKPLEGASVTLTGADGNGFARTSRNGSYQIRVPPGSYALLVEPTVGYSVSWTERCRWDGAVVCEPNADLYDFSSVRTIAGLAAHRQRCEAAHTETCLELRAGQPADVSVTFATGTALRGRLLAPDGSPLANASVEAKGPTSQGTSETDEDGAYEIALEPGAYQLRAEPRDWNVTVASTSWPCATGLESTCVHVTGTTWFNATLPRAAQLRGVITGPDGTPLEGAQVVATGGKEVWEFAMSDANGEYLIHLPTGEFVLHAGLPHQNASLAAVTILCEPDDCVRVRGSETIWRNVTLPLALEVHGVVKHPSGRPVRGTPVAASGSFGAEAYTDDEGKFTMRLAPGAHDLVAYRDLTGRVASIGICGWTDAPCVTGAGGESVSVEITLANATRVDSDSSLNEVTSGWNVYVAGNAKRPLLFLLPADYADTLGTRIAVDGVSAPALVTGGGLLWVASSDLAPGRHDVVATAPGFDGAEPRTARFSFELPGATPVVVTPPNIVTALPSIETPTNVTPTDPPPKAEPTPAPPDEERRDAPALAAWGALLALIVAVATRRSGQR